MLTVTAYYLKFVLTNSSETTIKYTFKLYVGKVGTH